MVKKILMVCYANTCRSPIAEAVMQNTLNKAGLSTEWQVDSAGITDDYEGNTPDYRAINVMKNHNLTLSNNSRQIKKEDFDEFDYIFGMDYQNIDDLQHLAPKGCKAKILLLGDFGLCKSESIIEDPYFQRGDVGFEKAYEQSVVACNAFLKEVQENKI